MLHTRISSPLLLSSRKFLNFQSSRYLAIVPFKLADIGEGIAEVELMKWFVKSGDKVKSFDRICEVQSDKATVEITSRYDGVIASVYHDEGSIVKVGSTLVDIETSTSGAENTAKSLSNPPTLSSNQNKIDVPAPFDTSSTANNKVLTTPAVRKIAKENKLDLSKIKPTGPKGRITKEDVLLYLQNGPSPRSQESTLPKASISAESTPATVSDQRVPIRGVQRLMVKSMNAANQVQHLTYCEEIAFDKIKKLRHDLKKQAASKGIKISYMPILIKATSLALTQFPSLNATVNSDVSEMIYHANHNIGVAIDTPKGLVVPVIKEVQKKSIFEIAAALNELQEAGSNGTLTEAQLSGGTFSLSNIGSIGGTYAVPVLVVPQVVIGAFGRLQVLPRYTDKDGNSASMELIDSGHAVVSPTTIMNVSWSADHRVVDGATVARFSNLWKFYLENPHVMLSELR